MNIVLLSQLMYCLDPEEFLTSLVAQILRAEPFLKLSSGQEAYHYQLFVEKDEALTMPTVQQLFEQSFLASDIKLKQVKKKIN
jgi:ubiquitin thioesterase CYLD